MFTIADKGGKVNVMSQSHQEFLGYLPSHSLNECEQPHVINFTTTFKSTLLFLIVIFLKVKTKINQLYLYKDGFGIKIPTTNKQTNETEEIYLISMCW